MIDKDFIKAAITESSQYKQYYENCVNWDTLAIRNFCMTRDGTFDVDFIVESDSALRHFHLVNIDVFGYLFEFLKLDFVN